MNYDIMMIFGNIGIIGMIFMNKILGNIVIGKGNEKENVKDLSLIGIEIMRGGWLNEVKVLFICDVYRVLECFFFR